MKSQSLYLVEGCPPTVEQGKENRANSSDNEQLPSAARLILQRLFAALVAFLAWNIAPRVVFLSSNVTGRVPGESSQDRRLRLCAFAIRKERSRINRAARVRFKRLRKWIDARAVALVRWWSATRQAAPTIAACDRDVKRWYEELREHVEAKCGCSGIPCRARAEIELSHRVAVARRYAASQLRGRFRRAVIR